jgi:hypothetical protein
MVPLSTPLFCHFTIPLKFTINIGDRKQFTIWIKIIYSFDPPRFWLDSTLLDFLLLQFHANFLISETQTCS